MLHICPKQFGCKQNVNKTQIGIFKCKPYYIGDIMGSIMKTACFSRLRQIIAHAAVGASADACDYNMTEVIFSSHHCVPGAISGTVFIGM